MDSTNIIRTNGEYSDSVIRTNGVREEYNFVDLFDFLGCSIHIESQPDEQKNNKEQVSDDVSETIENETEHTTITHLLVVANNSI